jgi:hypothetical protein
MVKSSQKGHERFAVSSVINTAVFWAKILSSGMWLLILHSSTLLPTSGKKIEEHVLSKCCLFLCGLFYAAVSVKNI